ncbi:hypothetical protein VIAE108258_12205 [Vibrio aerogenes]
MSCFTPVQQRKALVYLVLFHLLVIASSNYLVQLPFTFLGLHTTWGGLYVSVYLSGNRSNGQNFWCADGQKNYLSGDDPGFSPVVFIVCYVL